jgi:hypothetical protein
MSSLYVKGKTLYARFKDESGKWTSEATPFRPGQEVEARRYVKQLEGRISATRSASWDPCRPSWAERRGPPHKGLRR